MLLFKLFTVVLLQKVHAENCQNISKTTEQNETNFPITSSKQQFPDGFKNGTLLKLICRGNVGYQTNDLQWCYKKREENFFFDYPKIQDLSQGRATLLPNCTYSRKSTLQYTVTEDGVEFVCKATKNTGCIHVNTNLTAFTIRIANVTSYASSANIGVYNFNSSAISIISTISKSIFIAAILQLIIFT
ncbi:unnamed protein product [Mytilus coruscus]|uniref:Ig-like domain-containing protein n=1 Tax=Mytilus coruscus TaxID=42192 RepID=A0A6J8DND7_MYTCO|nr:unnamed protein product [Mytilus coruscus]